MQEAKDTQHVIVCTAYGCTDVYPATKARALQFFEDHKQAIPREVLELAQADPALVRYVSAHTAAVAILETFSLRPGAPAKRLREVLYGRSSSGPSPDLRPEVFVQEDWGREISYWLTEHNLIRAKLTGHDVIEHEAWLKLSMFTPAEPDSRELRLLAYDDYLGVAHAYRTITENNWKEGATEPAIAGYILRFVHANLVDQGDWKTLDVFPLKD